jgi:flavin reductase (DIM6/NTAB) family NADH-FMN oxidoreductase RutF
MITFNPKKLTGPEVHRLLLGGVGPRPIALVSTVSEEGSNNLSPFSFFNAFGSNPPVVAFSPARRGRDGTLKDTYLNLKATRECVINAVTYSMVEQVSLASTEYPSEIDEFKKSGLTPKDSEMVKAARVKESPFQMECKVLDIINFGEGGGSANLTVCEVVLFHAAEDIFRNGIIDPNLIDLVARMGGDFYCRASGDAIFEVEKPILKKGIGIDNLPDFIRNSEVYNGNNLGRLGNVESVPSFEDSDKFIDELKKEKLDSFERGEEAFFRYQRSKDYRKMLKSALESELRAEKRISFIELSVKCALEMNNTEFAWKAALHVDKLMRS